MGSITHGKYFACDYHGAMIQRAAMNGILLVEDSASDARDVRRALKKAGVKNPIKWIDDGAKAMQYLEGVAEPPALVVLDLKLPGLAGFEILDFIRDDPRFTRTLRIVLSSLDDIRTVKE